MAELVVAEEIRRYVVSDPSRRPEMYREFKVALTELVSAGHMDEARDAIRRSVSVDVPYPTLMSLYKVLLGIRGGTRDSGNGNTPADTLRVAILGAYTTQQLTCLADLFLFASGLEVDFYESEYGVFRQEVLNPDSDLYRFQPNIVVLLTGHRDVAKYPVLGDTSKAVSEIAAAEIESWKKIWELLFHRLGCQIIQNTFATPPWGIMGHMEQRVPSAIGSYLRRLNQSIFDEAPPHVVVHDMDALAASHGRWDWSDERFYFDAKLPCAPELLPVLANSLVSLILAIRGKSRKCLVLDLDNTLWGGVIGDDGMGGIILGHGDAQGEAFSSFQQYARRLKDRGVILAVCSKNDDNVAREPFESHPEMSLKMDDITSFYANWEDKATNLRRIAQDINIGLDSLVFFDDNPAERALVRRYLPAVAVPELPEDAAGYVKVLETHRFFETVSLNREDLERTSMYAKDARRQALMTSATDMDEYLASLNMKAIVEPINDVNLERISQLINKSNQFNLTTKRYSAAELQAVRDDSDWVARGYRLLDEFGDNGLICVVLGHLKGEALEIDTWLMSCRVLNRGVEEFVMNHIYDTARDSGVGRIEGQYLPTAKNSMVKEHYARLGFVKISESANGGTSWRLDIGDGQRTWKNSIIEEEGA